ncbi:MAG: polymer-forming cytoskeletal protein [Rickettsiales bacterium]|jgi:cytoskeletal protein CcmA (bactofilin family)|nr:polymer-forming cytoskeletal protein [Rickettsiales bacterium]
MPLIKNFTKDATPSVIATGTNLHGELKSSGSVEVEGIVDGNMTASTLTIREAGSVKGDVEAKTFNIRGKFEGKAISEKINISDMAIVNGALEYKFLVVDYGANINCDLRRIPDDKPVSSQRVQQLEPKDRSLDAKAIQ